MHEVRSATRLPIKRTQKDFKEQSLNKKMVDFLISLLRVHFGLCQGLENRFNSRQGADFINFHCPINFLLPPALPMFGRPWFLV